jgi:hypothetical protein
VPHIGEYAAKTNAISASHACLRAGSHTPVTRLAATFGCARGLLPVAFQHLIARHGYLGAIGLEASEDGEVALIDHRAAVALHVTGAGLLLLGRAAALLLGKGIRRNRCRHKGENQEKFTHRIPSFRQQKPVPELRFGMAGTDLLGLQTPRTAATKKEQALVNAAKFAVGLTSRTTI